VAAFMQLSGVNGPDYWQWRFHDEPLLAFGVMAAVAGAVVVWIVRLAENGADSRRLIWLAVALQLSLALAAVGVSDGSFSRVESVVKNLTINSYHGEAQRVGNLSEWLPTYSQRVPYFHLHAKTHPPGPILFYYFLTRWFGPDRAATVGGILVAILCALTGWALAALTIELSGEPTVGLYAALLWALFPAPILLMTSFDTFYPLLSALILMTWVRAAWRGSLAMAAACGVLLWLALFFAHNFLVLGAALALVVLVRIRDRIVLANALRAAVVGAAVVISGYLLLFTATGYNHLAALEASMEHQAWFEPLIDRPYSRTVFWDVYDFSLAAGWLPFGLTIAFFAHANSVPRLLRLFSIAGLGAVLLVDLSGMLRAETARVWGFLQPLLIPAMACELAAWPIKFRLAGYLALAFALAAIGINLQFVWF